MRNTTSPALQDLQIGMMNIDIAQLLNEGVVNRIAKNYSTLSYRARMTELLETLYPASVIEQLTKHDLHKLLNEILLLNYHGEEMLKYKLSIRFLNKPSIVGAFEINVNNSRLDFLTINGHTSSYEIKSELDNLTKLRKQMADYMMAFEFNYLVIDERHLEKAQDLLSPSFGLWSYKDGKYKKLRKPELNSSMEPEVQLRLLTKRELLRFFPNQGGSMKSVLVSQDSQYINGQFKKALKDRYRERWEFLIANQKAILPIDIQFFFNKNIKPDCIYS